MQKVKKKNFLWNVISCGFPISGDKRAEKVSGFFFSVRGERNCEINDQKKKKIFFLFSGLFLTILVVSLPEKMIRNFFGGKEKE